MLNAYLDGQKLIVKVSGSVHEFSADLQTFKGLFAPGDIEFDISTRRWIVSNLVKYGEVNLVKVARRASELQISLFEGIDMGDKTQDAVKKVAAELSREAPLSEITVNAALVMEDILRAAGNSEEEVKEIMGKNYSG